MKSLTAIHFTFHVSRFMHHASRFTLFVSLLALLLVGCGKVDMDAPPEIVYGRDICTRCGMIIEDTPFAASYMTTSGEPRIFDDMGDMMVHQAETGEEVRAYWVRDYETGEWLRAEEAFFVQTSEIHTPMGYGLLALKEKGSATAVSLRTQGTVMSFSELQQNAAMLKSSHNHSGHNH